MTSTGKGEAYPALVAWRVAGARLSNFVMRLQRASTNMATPMPVLSRRFRGGVRVTLPDRIVDLDVVDDWRRNAGNGKPVGTAADIFDDCGFDVILDRQKSEQIHLSQLKVALVHFAQYRHQVDALDGPLLDCYLVEWLTNTGWTQWAANTLLRAAVSSFPKTPTPKETIIETVDALLDADDVDDVTPWVLEGYVPEADILIVAGHPKVGKTTLAGHIAKAAAAGTLFLDRATQQRAVLWIDLEQGRRKMRAMVASLEVKGLPMHVWHCRGQRPTPEQIKSKIVELNVGLVVVDSLSKLWQGYVENENDNSETDRYLNVIAGIAETTSSAFLLIHHTRKEKGAENTDVRGGQAINQNAGVTVVVRKMEGGNDNRRLLTAISRYDETPATLVVARENDGYCVIGTEADAVSAEHEGKILKGIGGHAKGLTIQQIREATGMKDGLVRITCQRMEEKGLVYKLGKGGKTDPYRYCSEREILSLQPEEYREKEKTTGLDMSADKLEARYPELAETGTKS